LTAAAPVKEMARSLAKKAGSESGGGGAEEGGGGVARGRKAGEVVEVERFERRLGRAGRWGGANWRANAILPFAEAGLGVSTGCPLLS